MDLENNKFYDEIVELLKRARDGVKQFIDTTMAHTYFEIGRRIVEEEQNGKERAEYGKHLIKSLSKRLTDEFGKGFSSTNIKQMRTFYNIYGKGQAVTDESKEQKGQTVSDDLKFKLSWSHYLFLMRMDNENERKFYEIESSKNNWSTRELKRQFNSALFERLVLSRDKDGVKKLAEKGQVIEKAEDTIKEPYVLEFLGLKEEHKYSENDLENAIIDKLEHFLLELGKGFSFVARQKRITFDEKHFYIDLVFYNRFLKSFVLIDLKIGELQHQDIGQMQMYVNYYDREIIMEDENKTIGLILCKDKSDMVVKYTLPDDNTQIFASKYQTVLPSKEDLKKLIEE
jgi:predicted nuclease of restriction endonuclease-like (RecB) superfamily